MRTCVAFAIERERKPLREQLAQNQIGVGDRERSATTVAGGPRVSPARFRAVAGNLTRFIINLHYPTKEAYVAALADVLKVEYRAIVEAGFVLQIDAPDLARRATTSTAISATTNSVKNRRAQYCGTQRRD